MKCNECGEETTRVIKMLGGEYTVNIPCECERKRIDDEKARFEKMKKSIKIRQIRKDCFSTKVPLNWTFSNDDRRLKTVSDAMRRYAENWQEMKQKNIGILLHGTVGGGKTFYAACIANHLIDQGIPVIMTSFARVVNELQSLYAGKNDYIDRLARVPLLIIDDLGAERESEYMLEQVYTVIDARWQSKRPLICTTNIPMDKIKYPEDLTHKRIYDRVLEMCHPVEVNTESRRREALQKNFAANNRLLGLEI